MSALPARAAYRLWAATYDAETAVSYLEAEAVAALDVSTRGRSLLDVGCGTARRLRATDARDAVGVDLTLEMLGRAETSHPLAAADVLRLPFATESFDVVWCRLVLGHLSNLAGAYAELSRVCVAGGTVIVSDIASEAVSAGHRRTFPDASGTTHEVEHFVHSAEEHVTAALTARLEIERRHDGIVGPSIRTFYLDAGRRDVYEAQRGTPLVVAMSFRKVSR